MLWKTPLRIRTIIAVAALVAGAQVQSPGRPRNTVLQSSGARHRDTSYWIQVAPGGAVDVNETLIINAEDRAVIGQDLETVVAQPG